MNSNFIRNKKYSQSSNVISEGGKIKEFIQQTKSKNKFNNNLSTLNSFTELLYDSPSLFIQKFAEIKTALKNNEDYFDSMNNSLFYHYFIAMESAKNSNKQSDYDLLYQNMFNFIHYFVEQLSLKDSKGNTLFHFLARNGYITTLEAILDHYQGKNIINLKELNDKNENVLHIVLERSKKETFIRFYEKYSISYDMISLSETPEFQILIKMLSHYEKDLVQEMNDSLKNKNYEKFFTTMNSFKTNELKTIIMYPSMSFNYFNYFIGNNLEQNLQRFLELVQNKSLESIPLLFRDNYNILLTAVKKSNMNVIQLVLRFYLSQNVNNSSNDSLFHRTKSNILHYLLQNEALNFEDKEKIFILIKSSLTQETYKSLINQLDNLGNHPFFYALIILKEFTSIPSKYESFLQLIANDTNLEVYSQDMTFNESNLVYRNKNNSSKFTRKLIKNYVSHPSLCLSELRNSYQIIFMIAFLKRTNLLNFFVLDKIYELSVLDLILMKTFNQNDLEETNLWQYVYNNIIDFRRFSIHSDSNLYYIHLDSMINLILKCPETFNKVEYISDLLSSLKRENFEKFVELKIKKQTDVLRINNKLINISPQTNRNSSAQIFNNKVKDKFRDKYLQSLDSHLFLSLDAFINNIDQLNKDFEDNLRPQRYIYINKNSIFKETIFDGIKGINQNMRLSKKDVINTSIITDSKGKNYEYYKQKILFKFILTTDLINFLNNLNEFNVFSKLIDPIISLSLPFKFYDLIKFLFKRLNSPQIAFLTRIILNSKDLFHQLYYNNPVFLFTHVYDLVRTVNSFKMDKNLDEFIQIVNHIKGFNIYLSTLFDLMIHNLIKKSFEDLTKNQVTVNTFKFNEKNVLSSFKSLTETLEVHFPIKQLVVRNKTRVVNIFGIYNLLLFTNTLNERQAKLIEETNSVFHRINTLKYQDLIKSPSFGELNSSKVDQYVTDNKLRKIINNLTNPNNQNRFQLLRNNLNNIFVNLFDQLNYKMTRVLSNEHYGPHLNIFWNLSDYYIEKFNKTDSFHKELYSNIELALKLCVNLKKLSSKEVLEEKEQVFLLKNFVCRFNLSLENSPNSNSLITFKKRLEFVRDLDIINHFQQIICSSNEAYIIFSKSYSIGDCLMNKIIQVLYSSNVCEVFPYFNYNSFKEIFSNYSKNNTIEYINPWKVLLLKNPLRTAEDSINDIKLFVEETESRFNVVYINQYEEKKAKNTIINFETFDENFRKIMPFIQMKDYLRTRNKTYYSSTLSLILLEVFSKLRCNTFTVNLDLFNYYLQFFCDVRYFQTSDKNTSQLFMKITEITSNVYDSITPIPQNQDKLNKLSDLYFKIFSDMINELNTSDRTKLENYESNVITFTLNFALKLRSDERLKQYFNLVLSLKDGLFRELLFFQTFQLSLYLYSVFNDDLVYYKKIQQLSHQPFELTQFFNLKKDSIKKEIILGRNTFCKVLKKVKHSNLHYFAIANNSKSLLSHFSQTITFDQLKTNYLNLYILEKELIGLDKAVVISKNTLFLNEFKSIIQFNENFYNFMSSVFNKNDVNLIDSLNSLESFSLNYFILSCVLKKNNDIFIHYFKSFDDQRKKSIFDLTFCGTNLLHMLCMFNNYDLFIFLSNNFSNFNSQIIEQLSLKTYEKYTPLHLAIRSSSYEMYVLLEDYYSTEFKYNKLTKYSVFAEKLIERLVNKKLDKVDTIYSKNKSLFFYANVSVLFNKYISNIPEFKPVIKNQNLKKYVKLKTNNREGVLNEDFDSSLNGEDNYGRYSFAMNSQIYSFILTKPTHLGTSFFNMLDFQQINNVRVVINFFCNLLNLNFDLEFFKTFIRCKGFGNEKFFFDILYFYQKKGYKIYDVIDYYQYSGLIENYHKDFKVEENLNKDYLQDFNSFVNSNHSFSQIYSQVQTLFSENSYRILTSAAYNKYDLLCNFIYMKVLNCSFDHAKIIELMKDESENSLSHTEKLSLPYFIFNNFVLITQQLLTTKRYLFTDLKTIEHDNLHSMSLLFQYFQNEFNNNLLLDQASIYQLLFNDLLTGNFTNILKNQKDYLKTIKVDKIIMGKYKYEGSHFWKHMLSIFQRFRNQVNELISGKDFQYFLNDQAHILNFMNYNENQLEDIFRYIFEEFQNSLGFYKNGQFTHTKTNTVKLCNLFDVNISNLSSYFNIYRNYQKITNRKLTEQLKSNNTSFNFYVEKLSSLFEIILNFSELCEDISCQIEIFYNRLYQKRANPNNLKEKISLYQNINKITYLITFENMIENFKIETVEQRKRKLVNEFIVAIEKALKNTNYTVNISIPFIIRTEDLILIDSILNVNLNKSLSNYCSLYFDLLDSIFFNNTILKEFPDKLLYDNDQITNYESYDPKSSVFGYNFDQILDLKINLLKIFFNSGKLSFQVKDKPNDVSKLIIDYLTNNSGIVSPDSKVWRKRAPKGVDNNYGPLVVSISDIFNNNATLIALVENFINDIKNYQIYSTYRYFNDFIDFNLKAADKSFHLHPYLFTGFQSNANNVFFSNDKFELFLVDLVEKVSFLREFLFKHPNKRFEVNFDSLFEIFNNYVSTYQKVIKDNQLVNLRYLKSIFSTHSNSIAVMIDYFLESAPENSRLIFNFETNTELNISLNVNSKKNGVIDSLFVINNISVTQQDNSSIINYGIYPRNLGVEVLPTYESLDNLLSNVSSTSFNSDLCKHYQTKSFN